MTLKADLDRILGSAYHVAGKDFHTRIAHVENAGLGQVIEFYSR